MVHQNPAKTLSCYFSNYMLTKVSRSRKRSRSELYTPGSVVPYITGKEDTGDKWSCRCSSGPELQWRKKGHNVLKCQSKECRIYSHVKCYGLVTLNKLACKLVPSGTSYQSLCHQDGCSLIKQNLPGNFSNMICTSVFSGSFAHLAND